MLSPSKACSFRGGILVSISFSIGARNSSSLQAFAPGLVQQKCTPEPPLPRKDFQISIDNPMIHLNMPEFIGLYIKSSGPCCDGSASRSESYRGIPANQQGSGTLPRAGKAPSQVRRVWVTIILLLVLLQPCLLNLHPFSLTVA